MAAACPLVPRARVRLKVEEVTRAAKEGRLDVVRDNADRTDVHAAVQGLWLTTACQAGHLAIVQLLLRTGEWDRMQVMNRCLHVFQVACAAGHLDIVRAALGWEDDQWVNVHSHFSVALYDACCFGHVKVVQLLLSLQGRRCMHVQHARCRDVFVAACENGHTEVVQLLLELQEPRYIDVRAGKHAACLCACRYGHLEVVRVLLGMQGDRRIGAHAVAAMFAMACRWGHAAVAGALLDVGGDRRVDACHDNEAAFVEACVRGHVEVVMLLLRGGGDRLVHRHLQDAFKWAWGELRDATVAALILHRNVRGAPTFPMERRWKAWRMADGNRCPAPYMSRHLAAVRRSGAMAARAVQRRGRAVVLR
jgi:ankyrin repeat protein